MIDHDSPKIEPRNKVDVVWDMETGDPDDFITLILLLGHPDVCLKAVTVTPGTTEQIGLVRKAVNDWFERDIPIGSFAIDHPKRCVSSWHRSAYGEIRESRDASPGHEVLRACCDARTTLLTGAPLRNLGRAIREADLGGEPFQICRWVAQGGFAGEGVVPRERQLEKFEGLVTCPTYNFNGDPKAALLALSSPRIMTRRLVSKNVCHGVIYDHAMHDRLRERATSSLSLSLIFKGMEHYLASSPDGKKFHDPLAACCAIDESIATWAQVEVFRERGEWGARPSESASTSIIVDYDHERFLDVLMRS